MFFFSAEDTPGLSCCPNLRELSFYIIEPYKGEQALISSITSTNFRKLIFNGKFFIRSSRLDNPSWMRFDDMLCELTDRLRKLGHEHILEVEFYAEHVYVKHIEGLRHPGVLPKFREKERVSIVETGTGLSWEWSECDKRRGMESSMGL
jgi:hypothetical protein